MKSAIRILALSIAFAGVAAASVSSSTPKPFSKPSIGDGHSANSALRAWYPDLPASVKLWGLTQR